jgi:two-component system response regulator DesR
VALIRALVAEPVPLVREGLVASLARQCDIEVVADLPRGDVVVAVATSLLPDVAVLGVDLTGMDGFTVAEQLAVMVPDCHSMLLANRASPGQLRRAVAARAHGYLLKDASALSLAAAVRQVARGRKVLDPDLAFAAIDATLNPLTTREMDVLRLAAEGANCVEIAVKLSLAVGTVRNYLSRVIAKTGARNRVDAVRIADRSGWL